MRQWEFRLNLFILDLLSTVADRRAANPKTQHIRKNALQIPQDWKENVLQIPQHLQIVFPCYFEVLLARLPSYFVVFAARLSFVFFIAVSVAEAVYVSLSAVHEAKHTLPASPLMWINKPCNNVVRAPTWEFSVSQQDCFSLWLPW